MTTRHAADHPAVAGGPSRRPFSGRRGLAALALAGLAATAAGMADRAEPASPAEPRISLSMSVDAGRPVPISLITEQAAAGLYSRGFRGQGIDVALVDSGVAPVRGLDQPGKVLSGPDLSNEGGQPNLANLDTYGHGTHLAGIIAGDDGQHVGGIATESRIVSVKVAGATGETDIAQVIAGIDWVTEHKDDNGLNIRVLNLSLGVPGITTNRDDPLSAAVERAWDAGIVVVAAVGNRGNDAPGVDSPAVSPFPIAVGGTESYDSSGAGDKVATWSSAGNAHRTPDVVAPGRSILSLRVPGSTLDQLHPTAAVGEHYFRGSGTSQSAAVVSGFAALLLSADPTMTPDQVKYLIERASIDIAPGEYLDGSGRVDIERSARHIRWKDRAPVQDYPRALSSTTLQLASTTWITTDESLTYIGPTAVLGTATPTDATLTDSTLLDEATIVTDAAIVNDTAIVSGTISAPSGATWSGGSWTGDVWSGGVWSGATWSGATWSGATWSGGVWSGATWSGATWSGATWSGATWSGKWWSGRSWS